MQVCSRSYLLLFAYSLTSCFSCGLPRLRLFVFLLFRDAAYTLCPTLLLHYIICKWYSFVRVHHVCNMGPYPMELPFSSGAVTEGLGPRTSGSARTDSDQINISKEGAIKCRSPPACGHDAMKETSNGKSVSPTSRVASNGLVEPRIRSLCTSTTPRQPEIPSAIVMTTAGSGP